MPPLPPRFNIGGTRGQRTKLTGAIFLTDAHAPLVPSLHNVNSRGRGAPCSIDETSSPSTMLKVVQYFFHPQYWWRPCVRLLSPRFETRVFCPQSLHDSVRMFVFPGFPIFPPIYGIARVNTHTRIPECESWTSDRGLGRYF